jgi:hypothetical protein
VHVSAGEPTRYGWHRIEGPDATPTAAPTPFNPYCNHPYVHVDPHAIAFTSSLFMTLEPPPASPSAPYNEHTVLGARTAGDLWLATDGGVFHSDGAFTHWTPGGGMSTLATINVAGLAVKGMAPALYFGTGDNDDFYSIDGGAAWSVPNADCGDCDPWFADPAQVRQVMSFAGRTGGGFRVYTNTTLYPRPSDWPGDDTIAAHWVCPADCDAVSDFSDRGHRPMILTPTATTPPTTGDFLMIGTTTTGRRVVFRKTNAASMDTPADWEDPIKATVYGPDLPACPGSNAKCLDVAQGAGGHVNPVIYVGDPGVGHTQVLWKWAPGMSAWQQIVPSPAGTLPAQSAQSAQRFFADPYDPKTIYIVDSSSAAIKRSNDGGATWATDPNLTTAMRDVNRFNFASDNAILKDIVFVRDEPTTRFAVGNAGVFYTLDGTTWVRLFSTSAMPSNPVSAYFDNLSDPCDRALYVGLDGRGILRIDPIPAKTPPQGCIGTKLDAEPRIELPSTDDGTGRRRRRSELRLIY